MPSPNRRRVLAALAGISVFSGCSATSEDVPSTATETPRTATPTATQTATGTPSESPTPTATETETAEPPELVSESDFEFLVTVVRQPSSDAPGRVRAGLTNHTDRTLLVTGGDPVPVGFDTNRAEQVDASTPLKLFPQQSDAVNQYMSAESGEPLTVADAVYEGCWIMPDRVIKTAESGGLELTPEASAVADYFPLGVPDADCPNGTYRAYGEMWAESERGYVGRIDTTMEVTVGDGALSIDGSMSVSEP